MPGAVLIRGAPSGRSRWKRAISPPRPIATTTTPTRIAMAAARRTKYTTRWCHEQADDYTTSHAGGAPGHPAAGPPGRRESGVHAVIAQNVIERGLVVPVARGQPLQHKHAQHAELAAGEPAGAGAPDADRPGGHLPRGKLRTRLHVDHVGGGGENRSRADHGSCPHPRA